MVTRFRKVPALILFLVSALVAGEGSARAEETRPTYPTGVNLEAFGRGLLYDVQIDRMVNDNLAAGIGFGTVGTKDAVTGADAGKTATLVPVYMNYYFMKDGSSPLVTVGASLVANGDDVKGLKAKLSNLEFSNFVVPNFGLGYEVRSDQKFLFRLTGYGMFGKTFIPWFGFTFGIAF